MCHDYETFLESYDIKWIQSTANRNKLPNQKAPFLGALIKNIECLEGKNPIVKIVLKDVTGEIQGTIIHSLYEEYSKCLTLNSVIVLRQCSVITSCSNNHYLTITCNNLVAIYWLSKEEKVLVKKFQDVTCDGPKSGASSSRIEANDHEEEIWEDALKGVDLDALFDDF